MYKEQIQYTGKQYYRHNGFKALENQLEADPRHHINNQHKQSRRDKRAIISRHKQHYDIGYIKHYLETAVEPVDY